MPYELLFDGPVLLARFHGILTKDDLVAFADELGALEGALPVTPHRIADLRDVTEFAATFPDIFELAERRRASALSNSVRSAIVVSRPSSFGYARMFQTLNDHPQIDVELFEDEVLAWAWISAALRPPGS